MNPKHKLPITVIIAAKNEAVNMDKCLKSLQPARKIIVLDSQSKDGTAKIAKKMKAEVVQFHYRGGYPKKRQWGLDNLKLSNPWVLLIDADEEVPPGLWAEIEGAIQMKTAFNAYLIKKEFHFMGRKFKFGGFSFNAVLLFKTGMARFEHLIDEPKTAMDMEVHERLIVEGPVGKLKAPLIHNDYKNLEAYFERHNKYSTWEAALRWEYLTTGKYGKNPIEPKLFGNVQERRRFLKKILLLIPGEPILWFVYHYFFRLGFLEGRRGFIACAVRAHYIFQTRSKIYETRGKPVSSL